MNPGTPTVFVVDDDASFLTSVARLLRASRFAVKAFPSAAEFLSQLPADAAGCVVADLQMPGMNGSELQELLARTRNPLPVVFLTGHGEIPDSVCAMRQGAEDFLTKRAPREALLDAVRRALRRDARERGERARIRGLRARFDALSAAGTRSVATRPSRPIEQADCGGLGHPRAHCETSSHRHHHQARRAVRGGTEPTRSRSRSVYRQPTYLP